MSFFGLNFGGSAEIDIVLDNQDERKMGELKDENGRKERHYLFYDGESVTGKVDVALHRRTNKLEHQGIKIEFIGQIELYYDRGNHHEFLSLVKELARPGELTQNTSFEFEFNQVEKPFESYTGANVRLRYFLKVTIVRRLTDMTKEMDLLVHTLASYPEMNNPIKMEVGIEECLHIEFEYNKSKYHLKDVIVGKIYFLLVRIKIKHMEIAIIKRETTGSGPNTFHDNETIAKYEIMDGAPVKGESIPIRVFLAGYDLTPTMRDINKKFSVRYLLNLVLVDEEERRYFKQQEITLWRKGERMRRAPVQVGAHQIPHAMARHIPANQPVRTAPTPSDPTTPVDPSFASAAAAAGYQQQQQHEPHNSGDDSSEQQPRQSSSNNFVGHDGVEEEIIEAEEEEEQRTETNNRRSDDDEDVTSEPEVIEKDEVEPVKKEAASGAAAAVKSSSSSSSKISPKRHQISDDEDSDGKPKPPEDESVPPADSRDGSPTTQPDFDDDVDDVNL